MFTDHAIMNEETFVRRVAEIESYVRHTSFGCVRGTCTMDFYDHGQLLIDYLTTLVEADFYHVEDPPMPNTSCQSLANRCVFEKNRFQKIWRSEF